MAFLDRLRKAFSAPKAAQPQGDPNAIWLHFRCGKCGTAFRVRVDRRNDLSRDDEGGALYVRKEVMDNKCFQLMEAQVWFDANYAVANSEVRGGKLITAEEYNAARAS